MPVPDSDVPIGRRCKPRAEWPGAAADVPPPTPSTHMRQPILSAEGEVTKRPGHDNPASLHFERRRSTRTRPQAEMPNVASMRGKSYGHRGLLAAEDAERTSRLAATIVYSLLAASVVTASPGAPGLALPAFAYVSTVHGVDGAFDDFNASGDEECILRAFVSAANLCAYAVALTADFGGIDIPRSYKQALASKHADYWRDAIAKELGGLLNLGTWEMVPLADVPKGTNIMRCHYVFAVKRLKNGEVEKFKARLVADGNTQTSRDYDRIFSTVVKSQTIRAILIYSCSMDFNLSTIDVRQAYIQSDTGDHTLYMMPPPGVSSRDSQGRQLVCRLLRSLYGLRQAGRLWSGLFSKFLISWVWCARRSTRASTRTRWASRFYSRSYTWTMC